MKVCIVSHAYLERGYLPVLEGLAAKPGVELALITPASYTLGVQNSSGEFAETDGNYRTYPVPIRWRGRQGAFTYHFSGLAKALDEFKPDIIFHEQEVFALSALQVTWIASKRSIPLALQVWENLERKLAPPRQWIRKYVLTRAAGLTTASTESCRLHRAWGFKGPIEVIPGMGVDTLNLNPQYGRRNGNTLAVCYAGRLIPSKGIDTLLKAVATLHSKGIAVRCTIAGRGVEHDRLTAMAGTLRIADVVDMVGILPSDQVKALLRTSDVLVLPSRRTKVWEEQFGRVLAEAMAEATVTVGSRTGAIPEVIGNDKLVFEEDDHNALSAILENLATDQTVFEFHQHQLWERARNHYVNDILATRKVRFLREILESTGHPPVLADGDLPRKNCAASTR